MNEKKIRTRRNTSNAGDELQRCVKIVDLMQALAQLGHWCYEPETEQIHWSRELCAILDLEADKVTADFAHLFALVHPEDRSRVEDVYGRSLAQGSNHDIEYRIELPDGTIRHIEDRCRHTIDQQRKTTCSTGFLQDISELHETRKALGNSRAELDTFAGIAAHDLQEPLRAILGFLQLLEKRNSEQLDDKGKLFVERSIKAGRRMERQINELLKFARITSRGEEFAETDLNPLLDEAVNRLDPIVDRTRAKIIRTELPVLMVDPQQIETLFYNLLHNGLRYNNSERPCIEVESHMQQQCWRFSFRDNGIGIAAEFQQRVFELFQRLHSEQNYPGIGTGLTVSRKIVERHGGSIWVESAEQQGATFFFTLPLRSVI